MIFEPRLNQVDPEIHRCIDQEMDRAQHGLELIASENYVSLAVLEAQGSILTNKYAEGYPHHRYYGGCQFVDEVEELAIQRACELFGAQAANVQPHSGSQANMAAYFALLKPGDTILGMDLSQGGHLTHGSSVNFSGKLFRALSYGVHPETQRLDYDQIRDQIKTNRPHLLVVGASAYPRQIDFKILGEIASEAGIPWIADIAHISGLVAVGLHPSPIASATYTTTTTHKTLRGPRGGMVLCDEKRLKAINRQVFPGMQGGPLMHVIAAKAVCFREALDPRFLIYQKKVLSNAQTLAHHLMQRGLPLVTQGTDNHLMLIDLSRWKDGSTTGQEAEAWLDQVGITVNKNTVPYEKRSPQVTSGIRLGVPALTTRGMGTEVMEKIAEWIEAVLTSKGQSQPIAKEVESLCASFPMYPRAFL
jgi:glycine hydroxymethyltransferase